MKLETYICTIDISNNLNKVNNCNAMTPRSYKCYDFSKCDIKGMVRLSSN